MQLYRTSYEASVYDRAGELLRLAMQTSPNFHAIAIIPPDPWTADCSWVQELLCIADMP